MSRTEEMNAEQAKQQVPGGEADKPTEIPAKGWLQVVKSGWAEAKADQVPLLAAGVAFYGFLALFPSLIATVLIYGLVVAAGEDHRAGRSAHRWAAGGGQQADHRPAHAGVRPNRPERASRPCWPSAGAVGRVRRDGQPDDRDQHRVRRGGEALVHQEAGARPGADPGCRSSS